VLVPVQRTWTSGETVTAGMMNDDIRDAVNFLLSPPMASLRSTANQSVNNATETPVVFGAEDKDNDGIHSTVSNTSRCTVATAGWYNAWAQLKYGSDPDGWRRAAFKVNGVGSTYGDARIPAVTGVDTTVATFTKIPVALAVGDYVEVLANHTAGAAINVEFPSYFGIEFSGT